MVSLCTYTSHRREPVSETTTTRTNDAADEAADFGRRRVSPAVIDARREIASFLYGACKQVSKFLKLPCRHCSASGVLEYLLRFHSLQPKRIPVFQMPPVIKKIGHVKRKFHEDIGGMRCGPARRWVQALLEARKTSGKRWLRFFNGKRILRDMLSEEFKEWSVDKFAEALVLRSLRAMLGVRSQLYGTMCAALAVGRIGGAVHSGGAHSWPTIVRPTWHGAWIGRN